MWFNTSQDELESLSDKKNLPSPSGSDISDLAASTCVKRNRLNGDLPTSGDDDEDDVIEVLYDGPSPPAGNAIEETDSDIEIIEDVPPAEPKGDENVDVSTDSIEEVAIIEMQPDSEKTKGHGDVVEKATVADVPEVPPADVVNVEKENGSKVDY